MEPQARAHLWDQFKVMLQNVARSFSRGSKQRHARTIAALQERRSQLLSSSPVSVPLLQTVDEQIEGLLRQETQQYMLRSATRWHEQGERNNKYFFGVIKSRQNQQTIQTIRCSQTGDLLLDSNSILRKARSFYSSLYSPEDVDTTAINTLLSCIPDTVRISSWILTC